MLERTDSVTPAPIRFELVWSQTDPALAHVDTAPSAPVESGATPRPLRRPRANWVPAVAISLLVHAALFAAAAFVVVSRAGKPEDVPTQTEEPMFTLDLRTASILSNTQQQVFDPLPESTSGSSVLAPPEVELVPLPPLEFEIEPVVEETQAPPWSFSDSLPPPASAKSSTRLPARAPRVAKGSPSGMENGVGASTAAQSASASAEGKPGGEGTASTGSGPPWISSGLLQARHIERPRYPDAARQRGDQGVVTCRLTIGCDGEVIDVVVEESSGFTALDDEAVRALKRWRFKSLAEVTDSPRVQALQRLEFKLGRG